MNRSLFLRLSLAMAAFALAAFVVLSLAHGTDDTHTQNSSLTPAATPAATPGTAAMRAYVNPETGAVEVGVGPVAGATRQMLDPETQNALRRDADGLVETHHPDGSVSINLQGRFQSVSVLKRGEDGDVIVCTDNADDTRRALQGKTTPEVK